MTHRFTPQGYLEVVLRDGEALLARLDRRERERALRKRKFKTIVREIGRSPTGGTRAVSHTVPRR